MPITYQQIVGKKGPPIEETLASGNNDIANPCTQAPVGVIIIPLDSTRASDMANTYYDRANSDADTFRIVAGAAGVALLIPIGGLWE